MRRSLVWGGLAALAIGGHAWAATGPTLQDRQQAACYNDVMRLCGDAVPDVDRVTACMKSKKKLVSAPCAAFYPPGQR
jgi:hypothetical protein